MSPEQVIVVAGAIITTLLSGMGIIWKQGNDREATINKVWEGRMADKDAENAWLREQLISFRRDFATEAREDRAVMERLRETVQAATSPVQRGRR